MLLGIVPGSRLREHNVAWSPTSVQSSLSQSRTVFRRTVMAQRISIVLHQYMLSEKHEISPAAHQTVVLSFREPVG